MKRRDLITATAAIAATGLAHPFNARSAPAISDNVVKLGVLTDLSGMYSDGAGPGSVLCAQLAAEEFSNTVAGKPIQIIRGGSGGRDPRRPGFLHRPPGAAGGARA